VKTLATLLLLSTTTSAQACHHYSRWYYHYPQPRCGVAARGTPADDHTWNVEITKMPDDLKPILDLTAPAAPEDDRTKALDKLKEQLK
jgi:hypothetical protein